MSKITLAVGLVGSLAGMLAGAILVASGIPVVWLAGGLLAVTCIKTGLACTQDLLGLDD